MTGGHQIVEATAMNGFIVRIDQTAFTAAETAGARYVDCVDGGSVPFQRLSNGSVYIGMWSTLTATFREAHRQHAEGAR